MIATARSGGSLLAAYAASLLTFASTGLAQPAASGAPGERVSAEADDTTSLPGQARRVVQEDSDASDALLLLPRLALAAPRLVVRTVMGAAVTGTRIEDRHHLIDRAEDFFFDDTRTYGVFPTLFYETGFNTNVGARAVHRDLFGVGARLHLRAGYGGADRQVYEGHVHTGHWLPGGRISIHVGYERARDDFYGVGNADLTVRDPAAPPIDALSGESAVRARYVERKLYGEAGAITALSGHWYLDVLHRLRLREIAAPGDASAPALSAVYRRDTLAGFGDEVVDAYTELGLGFDGAHSHKPDVPDDLPSSGVRLDTWTGMQAQLEAPREVFATVGADLQPYFDLYRADRVLRLRLRVVSVVGPLDTVPVADLPQLGGSRLLRGYPPSRFRGRVTALTTAEYRYPVQERMAAYLFVDAGRAYVRVEDLSPEGLRVGFGGGLLIYGGAGARVRFQLASSIDGGLYFHVKADTTDEPQRTP